MPDWLVGLAVAVGLMVAGWALLILLARRLPPGPLRDLARFIPDCVTTVRAATRPRPQPTSDGSPTLKVVDRADRLNGRASKSSTGVAAPPGPGPDPGPGMSRAPIR